MYIPIHTCIHILYIDIVVSNGKRKPRHFSPIRLPFTHRKNGTLLFVRLMMISNGLNGLAHLCISVHLNEEFSWISSVDINCCLKAAPLGQTMVLKQFHVKRSNRQKCRCSNTSGQTFEYFADDVETRFWWRPSVRNDFPYKWLGSQYLKIMFYVSMSPAHLSVGNAVGFVS